MSSIHDGDDPADGMVAIDSPRRSGQRTLNADPSKASLRSKVFTGTGDVEQEKAHRTYLNELGPGQYSLPPLTGRHSLESKRRNIPNISFGAKVKTPWHAEFHTDFVGKSSPPSTRYSMTIGKLSNQRSTSKLGAMNKEDKFREPTSVTKLRETLPCQY